MFTKCIASKTWAKREKRVDAAVLGHLLVYLLLTRHQPARIVVNVNTLAPDGVERHLQLHGRFAHFNLRPELLVEWRGAVWGVDEDVGSEFG